MSPLINDQGFFLNLSKDARPKKMRYKHRTVVSIYSSNKVVLKNAVSSWSNPSYTSLLKYT